MRPASRRPADRSLRTVALGTLIALPLLAAPGCASISHQPSAVTQAGDEDDEEDDAFAFSLIAFTFDVIGALIRGDHDGDDDDCREHQEPHRHVHAEPRAADPEHEPIGRRRRAWLRRHDDQTTTD